MDSAGITDLQKMSDQNCFGSVILHIRQSHRLMRKQVAIEAKMDPSYLTALERGRRSPPPPRTLDRLIGALNANDAEQRAIRESAAVARISRVIDAQSLELPETRLITLVTHMVPSLDERGIDAIRAVLYALAARQQIKEIPM
jgi:transcriptional regulator with XRE-family HTH domain